MRRVLLAIAVSLAVAASWAITSADRSLQISSTQRNPIRAYVGATPQQYDTLAVSDGERVELQSFSVYADDSAQTPTLGIWFVSKNTKTVYLRLAEAYTANQVKFTHWTGPWVFPKDTTILVYYNLTGATPGTLDTLRSVATWKLERP